MQFDVVLLRGITIVPNIPTKMKPLNTIQISASPLTLDLYNAICSVQQPVKI